MCVSLLAFVTFAVPATAQNQDPINVPYEMHNSLIHATEAKILDWLRDGGDPDTVLDEDGNTFMHYAATNLLSILQEAVRRGGDCNRKNSYGATPLHFAASQDNLGPGAEALRILVRCEASPSARRDCTSGDRTAEDCRADPNAQDRRGDTPLHAVYEGVERSAHPPVRNLGTTDLKDSGGGRRADVLRVLLEEAGADPNIRNRNGDAPLMLLIRSGGPVFSKPGHVSHLLKHGADPDTRNDKGATPFIETVSLFSAVRDDDDSPRIIRLLIKHGADPDLRDGRSDTPLIRAAQHDDDSVFEIEALLAGGADPCLRDRAGKLAYDHAQPDGALALYEAGGYPDRETGICVRDLLQAEEREKKLALDRSARRQLQSCLKTAGFDPGAPDGLFGPHTRTAVRAWQAAQGREGIEAAGYFAWGETDALLEACRTAGPEPLCTGQTGSGCWMEVADQPGCHIWNENPQLEETVTWSGRCVDGKVSGTGRAVWRFREDGVSKSSWNEGSYLDGKEGDGHWVLRTSSGNVWEGPIVSGEYHGLWVKRGSGGSDVSCRRNGERADRSRCVAPADGKMHAVKRSDLRSGPGDDYERLGALQAEAQVTVTGESGRWLSVETQDGRGGFVRASALVEMEDPEIVAILTEPRCKDLLDVHFSQTSFSIEKAERALDEHGDLIFNSGLSLRGVAERLGLQLEGCWKEVSNISGCYVYIGAVIEELGPGNSWHNPPGSDADILFLPRLTWNGECKDGVVHGEGEYFVERGVYGPNYMTERKFLRGKRSGQYHRSGSRCTSDGQYGEGVRVGEWRAHCTGGPNSGDHLVVYQNGIPVACSSSLDRGRGACESSSGSLLELPLRTQSEIDHYLCCRRALSSM